MSLKMKKQTNKQKIMPMSVLLSMTIFTEFPSHVKLSTVLRLPQNILKSSILTNGSESEKGECADVQRWLWYTSFIKAGGGEKQDAKAWRHRLVTHSWCNTKTRCKRLACKGSAEREATCRFSPCLPSKLVEDVLPQQLPITYVKSLITIILPPPLYFNCLG